MAEMHTFDATEEYQVQYCEWMRMIMKMDKNRNNFTQEHKEIIQTRQVFICLPFFGIGALFDVLNVE